jgi:hypothetical protein
MLTPAQASFSINEILLPFVIIKEHSVLHGTPILGHEILLQEEAVKPAQEKNSLSMPIFLQ